MRPDTLSQRGGQLDSEHHARAGHRHTALPGCLIHIPAGLAHRDAEPGGQHRGGLGHRNPVLQEPDGSVDPLSMLHATRATASHDINVLPDMSTTVSGTP